MKKVKAFVSASWLDNFEVGKLPKPLTLNFDKQKPIGIVSAIEEKTDGLEITMKVEEGFLEATFLNLEPAGNVLESHQEGTTTIIDKFELTEISLV